MRKRTGSLVKKRGKYYLVVSGWDAKKDKPKRIWLATGMTTRRDAEDKAVELNAPFAARDAAVRLAHLSGQADAARINADALEDAADPGITIKDAFDAYERKTDRPAAGEATVDQYRCQWGRFEKWLAKAHPDCKTMKQVSPAIARAFMEALSAEKASANTFNKYRGFLGMVFRELAKPGRVTVNPWLEIKPKQLQTAHRRPLTVEELRTVCGKATGELRLLLALGVYTGARLGDCCTMTWSNVDLARGEIRYSPRKTASRTDGKTLTIPLHAVLLSILSETPKKARRGFIAPTFAVRYNNGQSAYVSQIIQKHLTDCGLETAGESRGKRQVKPVSVGFHSLRHSAVSMLRDAGASMAAAMAITGHTSAALLDVYTHAGADTVRAAVAALPAIGGNYTPPPSDAEKLAKVLELAKTMTAENWQTVQDGIVKTAGS